MLPKKGAAKKADTSAQPTRTTRSQKRSVATVESDGDDAAASQPQPRKRTRTQTNANANVSKSEPAADLSDSQSQPTKKTRGRSKANSKPAPAVESDEDASEPQPQPKKGTRTKANGSANGSKPGQKTKAKPAADADGSQSEPAKQTKVKSEAKSEPATQAKEVTEFGEAQIAHSSDVRVPLDEYCPLTHYTVYIDDDGIIYDASLNQTNAGNNNNKFYRVQVLRSANHFQTWTRWGRVGDRGQSKMLGSGSLESALGEFNKKFKDKSGLTWENRGEQPNPKKYTFVERSYAPDSDDEQDDDGGKVKKEDEKEPESKLTPAVQDLMCLIFNQQYFSAAMADLNYDVKKLPLGKLSKNTISRGFQTLKDISLLIDDASLAQSQYGTSYAEAAEQLSNAYFSLIPHAFGRNRPPVIQSLPLLKKEIELLESLGDMKDAQAILKAGLKGEELNIVDRQFQGLGLDEMTPLEASSTEFIQLKDYLVDTRGATHGVNYQVDQIFRIQRQGEKHRFESSEFAGAPRNRRLLWHGSRTTNFGGILSQGLRIAPPEAPVSGYMFGKGIYLADMSSKSANYCCSYSSNGHALLLLCEAELGDPIQTLLNASYNAGEDAKAQGMWSTWGQGATGPSLWKDAECVHPSLKGIQMPDTSIKPGNTNVPGAYLQYNEYIAYDVAQVRLRYLFRVKM